MNSFKQILNSKKGQRCAVRLSGCLPHHSLGLTPPITPSLPFAVCPFWTSISPRPTNYTRNISASLSRALRETALHLAALRERVCVPQASASMRSAPRPLSELRQPQGAPAPGVSVCVRAHGHVSYPHSIRALRSSAHLHGDRPCAPPPLPPPSPCTSWLRANCTKTPRASPCQAVGPTEGHGKGGAL